MPTVVHLTNVHPSNDVRIFVKECQSLANAGYQVKLIAPLIEGHRSDCVDLIPLSKSPHRFLRMLSTWKVLKLAVKQRAQIYHFHDPELIPVGIALKFLGKKVVYDVHENVRLSILSRDYLKPWIRIPLSWIVRGAEKVGGWLFDGLAVATPSIGKQFYPAKILLLQNYPLLDELQQSEGRGYHQRAEQICYLGWISKHRGAFEMCEAARLVADKRKDFKFVMAGDTQEEPLRSYLKNSYWGSSTNFLGFVNRSEAQALLNSSRMGLLLFHPEPNHLESQPTKIFEYMIAGLPVIASDFPQWRSLINRINCGLVVNPLDPESIARAIHYLLDNPQEADSMGQRGRAYVMAHCHWEQEVKGLIHLYEKILA